MTPAVAAILEGMPEPRDLHRAEHDGMTFVSAGSAVLACYPPADAGMRNVAVAVLRQLGFSGQAVAAVMGLPGIVRESGRPRKLAEAAWARARRWRAEGASDTEIARRLGVAQSTVFRRLGPAAVQEQLPFSGPGPEAGPAEPEPVPEPEPSSRPAAEAGPPAGTEAAPSRYAGAMLAHAYYHRIGAEAILAAALPPGLARPRYDDLALLTAASLAFALGVSSAEGTKHLIPDQAGILAGIGRLPGLRTLR